MEIDVIEEHVALYDFVEELRKSNRGSKIEIKIERLAPGFPPLFQRFYTCFDALRRGFLDRCDPFTPNSPKSAFTPKSEDSFRIPLSHQFV
ncbi:hypothetical protein Godav_006065 [Gossypium davidsonii]|uniref:Uncharacterized protein n=1 Tax=Gossypium davidsonii TaxID=34287 RepID=A0A7J8S3F5_GOSDV|nr:hypothetical protein [Gossypium davidsonii]